MTPELVYVAGGTVQASGGIYIERDADRSLLELCRAGAFCYVLTSRQVGKSSLMVRTAERLKEAGCRPVLLDLTKIGVNTTADAWYRSILFDVASQLDLNIDVAEWWNSRSDLSVTYRFSRFFHDLLQAIASRIVIFVDEIDSTLSLNFTDDFFAAVRALHNIRATEAEFTRLSFVVLGAATPSQLIQDPSRTPFNLGERVELTDFSEAEARPLLQGLHLDTADADIVLRAVLSWTGGHPYLTLRTFRSLQADPLPAISEAAVEGRIRHLFLWKEAQVDTNLAFVREMLTVRARDVLRTLNTYRVIWTGAALQDQERDPVIAHLKLSGVVKAVNDTLQVRNRIYRETFGRDWILRHTGAIEGDVIYAAGGAVQAARGIYVERHADALLLHYCRSSVSAHILAPRQVGKTSLMVHAADVLRKEGISTVAVHLAELGLASTEERWYHGIIRSVAEQLFLTTDIELWWDAHGSLRAADRAVSFLTDVVLPQIPSRIVIFFDELEVSLGLPFRQEFFDTLRELHARGAGPQLDRLNFVLLGAGRPSDFVGDVEVSVFQASEAIELADYTTEEAAPLARGLPVSPGTAQDVLRTVMALTGGHPYLTLRTFQSLQEQPLDEWTAESVTDRLLMLFVESGGERDYHIEFVRNTLAVEKHNGNQRALLNALLNVWTGRQSASDTAAHARLATLGVLASTGSHLRLRNRIYEDVFNPDWIRAQLQPSGTPRGRAVRLWRRSTTGV